MAEIDRVLESDDDSVNGEAIPIACTATAHNLFPPGSAAVTFAIQWKLIVRALCATVPE